jgi:hypothetical protein
MTSNGCLTQTEGNARDAKSRLRRLREKSNGRIEWIVTAHAPMEGQEMDWKRWVQFALGSSDIGNTNVQLRGLFCSGLMILEQSLGTVTRSDIG